MSEFNKKCCRCDDTKPLEEFNWRNKAKGKRQSYCIVCDSEYRKSGIVLNILYGTQCLQCIF